MKFLQSMLQHFEKQPDKALLLEARGRSLVPFPACETLEQVARARSFIQGAGVGPGDRVALLAPNSARWVAADLGILTAGAICVPLYSRQQPRQLAAMLKDCTPSLLLVSDEELEREIREAWPDCCRIARFEEFFVAEPSNQPPVEAAEEAVATIIYTSGTSGEAKGVMLSGANLHYMLQRAAAKLDQATGHSQRDDRFFHYLPLCFGASRIACWSQLFRGNPVILSTDLNQLVDEIAAANPHYFLNVPALLERIRSGVNQKVKERGGLGAWLYQKAVGAYGRSENGGSTPADRLWLAVGNKLVFEKIRSNIGPSLEFLISGSAPLKPETQNWFQMLGIPVYQVYGLTETTGIVTMDEPVGGGNPGSVGRAIDGCEVKVTEQGELLCRGPNIFQGYWQRPEATEQVLRDGWFHTGDQVELGADGSVKIVGRIKDLLVPEAGHNVAPEPIESKLVEVSESIEQAVVVGHGKPFLAAIVTGSAAEAELERAREAVNAELPHYQRIKKVIRVPEPFTIENELLTANGKLRRRAIESHYQNEIESMYR